MTLDLRKLQQRLESTKPSAIYLLMGEESFLVQEAVQLLKTKTVNEGTIDFNCDVFDVGQSSVATVRDAAEMLPMMSERRFVALRGVDDLKEKDWDLLFPLIDNPVESTTLVLTCESLDKRKKAFKKLSESAIVVELKRPYDNQIGDWIDYLAYKLKLKITREASAMLKQFVGTNLTELNNELAKLKDYLDERNQVEANDVLQVVSQTRVDRIFDLTDAIGKKDRAAALQSLASLLEHGQNEVGILVMVTRHFRILGQLKEGVRDGLSGMRLCAKAGIPQFLLNSYLDQVKLWDEASIVRTFKILLDTDRALKSSNIPPHVWLENFVLKTCA